MVGPRGKLLSARALLDACSDVTLISISLARKLGTVLEQVDANITAVGGEPVVQSQLQTTLVMKKPNSDFSLSFNAHCLGRLGLRAPSAKVCLKTVERCLRIGHVADPMFGIPGDIDILIKANVYHRLIQPGLH